MLITEFYRNKELFITGGTGFLGKSLIEKLLRECPDISKMYLLIRTKQNKTPIERLKEFSNDLVFERLHREQPKAFEKVIPIAGDSAELGMNISQEDMERLKDVNIIIHGAANVRFNNNLREAILMNTRGTHEVLKIAVTLKQLIAFIHISTAYINPFQSYIEEKIYDAPVHWLSAIKIAETYDTETLDILQLKYTKYYPNAYSFTKNLSEQIINEFADKLPITILRPSVVAHSIMEPEPGYVDNLNGPIGLIVAIASGLSQVAYCNGDLVVALINVDTITKLTIIATYIRGLEAMNSKKCGLDIRNLTHGSMLKYNVRQAVKLYLRHSNKEPFEKTLWSPSDFMSNNYFLFIMCVLFVNIPLALVYDLLLMLSKKERMVLKLVRKYVYASKAIGKFSHKFFDIQNDGMMNMLKFVPESEKEKFGFITTADNIDIDLIVKHLHVGVKKFILKEPVEATAATQRRYKILKVLDKIIKLLLFVIVIGYLWKMVN